MSGLWSTLRVGTWTEREQVTTWLQRAHEKRVVIDMRQDDQRSSHTPPFAALQDALATTSQWYELTISSFFSENMAGHLSFQAAMPMDVLRSLHVEAGCVLSPSFTHLLELIPTDAPLSELRLHSSFATTYFLQPPWFPAFQNLTVLIINGRDIHEPFDLLPAFTRIHIFEADRLPLPWYELDIDLPLLFTLQKLQLRASSVQWMAGRVFSCLKECTILLPRLWEAVRQHEVQLPSCSRFTYHGYPMTTAQHFHVPHVRAMDLRFHDCKKWRVYQQFRILCRVDGRFSKLTTLHLTLQCSEQVLIMMLGYLSPLQELSLSIAHPPHSWKHFLKSLVAKPSRDDWPDWTHSDREWEQWCSSQAWHVNVLPHLKYLSILCPKRFSESQSLDNSLLFRLSGWSRAQLVPPLEHLKVWEGTGTKNAILVDYISNHYPGMGPGRGKSSECDTKIIRGMITRHLVVADDVAIRIFQFQSTTLFKKLQDLDVKFGVFDYTKVTFLPFLKQIERLKIQNGISERPLGIDLPLIHTLQRLELRDSTFSWIFGMTFKALGEFRVHGKMFNPRADVSRDEGLQVDLPACTLLELVNFPTNHLHLFFCPNLQILRWEDPFSFHVDPAPFRSLRDLLCNAPCLQRLEIRNRGYLEREPLLQFLFCDTWEEGAWRDIRSVEVDFQFTDSIEASSFFDRVAGHQQHYEKWWREFRVTIEANGFDTVVRASM